jgi:hypothetical protein
MKIFTTSGQDYDLIPEDIQLCYDRTKLPDRPVNKYINKIINKDSNKDIIL